MIFRIVLTQGKAVRYAAADDTYRRCVQERQGQLLESPDAWSRTDRHVVSIEEGSASLA